MGVTGGVGLVDVAEAFLMKLEEEKFVTALEEVLCHGVQVVGGTDPPPCKLSPHQLLELKVFLEVCRWWEGLTLPPASSPHTSCWS